MHRYLPSAAALALAACFAPACLAAYTATADVNATALGRVLVGDRDQVVQGSSDLDHDSVQTGSANASAGTGVHAQQDSADAGGGSSAWAQVAAGAIHLQAGAIGSALFLTPGDSFGRILGRSNAFAGGSFSDGVTFSVAGLAQGTPLVLTFSVDVTGSLASIGNFAAGVSGYSTITDMRWHVGLGDLSDGRSESVQDANGDIIRNAPATGVWTFVSTVGNGVATVLTMDASIGAAAQGGINCGACGLSTLYAEGQSDADFSHTFAWNGIQGVTDAFGHTLDLAELQVTSSSGFDYLGNSAAPVPEASTSLLLAVGLLALLLHRRQRRAAG